MMAAVSSAAARFTSAQNTLAPSRAKVTAVALPLPQPGPIEPAPATSATLSLRRSDIEALDLEFSRWRHSGSRAKPASPEPMNTDRALVCTAGVHGFRARRYAAPRNDGR